MLPIFKFHTLYLFRGLSIFSHDMVYKNNSYSSSWSLAPTVNIETMKVPSFWVLFVVVGTVLIYFNFSSFIAGPCLPGKSFISNIYCCMFIFLRCSRMVHERFSSGRNILCQWCFCLWVWRTSLWCEFSNSCCSHLIILYLITFHKEQDFLFFFLDWRWIY